MTKRCGANRLTTQADFAQLCQKITMDIITTTPALRALCTELAKDSFVAVDTEFMREQTYWPELCLVQIAGSKHEAIIDPLAPEIDLEPFFALMAKASVLKVFHAARQDVEIVFHRSGIIPTPLFDTQIAAMVCGFGDQVSYEQIVRKLAKAQIESPPASPIGRGGRSPTSSSPMRCRT